MNRSGFNNVIPIAYGHGEFFIEFLYKSIKSNLKILEVPYVQPPDVEGISKTAPNVLKFIRLGINYFIRVIIARIRIN